MLLQRTGLVRNGSAEPWQGNAKGDTPKEMESIQRRHILQKEQNLIKIVHHEEMSMLEPYSARGISLEKLI